ncbi:MAG: methyltransferase domain-containing protein [Candidatus Moranbacteria bacterium]|nr:methyltransferase domain-containing protein [Candidatus Moranbacteria bacterium]
MPQKNAWEKEYQNPLFITKGDKPQSDVLRFLKFFKKQTGHKIYNLRVLDLGCGTGRNANYLANLDNTVCGIEISPTALSLAQKRAQNLGVSVQYLEQSIGEKYPFADKSFDLILDVTSSNALNERERETYLQETARTLQNEGYLFVRALCRDGDKNAKKLIEKFPGAEKDTYEMPRSGLVERVFSEQDFRATYGKFFQILQLSKKTGYTNFDGQPYKRNYWIAYLKKIS